jgi:hypothetical protein
VTFDGIFYLIDLMYRCLLQAILFISLISGCEPPEEKEKRLATTYCGSCHAFPDPFLLPKKTWISSVLPEMKFRMGFANASKLRQYSEHDRRVIRDLLPESPMLSEEEFEAIASFYQRLAPDSLGHNAVSVAETTAIFAAELLSLNRYPVLSMIAFDSNRNEIIAGTRFGELIWLNANFQETDSVILRAPVSHLLLEGENTLALTMGIMDPNDEFKGQLISIGNGRFKNLLIDSLQRPVYAEMIDLDGNGKDDLVVCSFGNYSGGLLAYAGMPDGKYVKRTISSLPGARRTIIRDVDSDGQPDILALFAQGDEHLALFLNKGNFEFEKRVLLRFPPVYGSSWFEINDLNQDGQFDILYTNGDNADYSPEPKPYHGVRYFQNKGDNTFQEVWFHPMAGASEIRQNDFDLDGDQDLLAIAYFPDYRTSAESSILLFENRRDTFVPFLVTGSTTGRWMTMDTGDFDFDGDIDAVIAALNFEPGVPRNIIEQWQQKPVSLLVLRNKTR